MSNRTGTSACYVNIILEVSGFNSLPPQTLSFWSVVHCNPTKRDEMLKLANEDMEAKPDYQWIRSLAGRLPAGQIRIGSSCQYWTGKFDMSRVLKEERQTGAKMRALRHHLRHLPDVPGDQPAA